MPQPLKLVVETGSLEFPDDASITLAPSSGLELTCDKLGDAGISVGGLGPAQTVEFDCEANAELKPRTGEVVTQYEVSM